jgi:hypothetical protein
MSGLAKDFSRNAQRGEQDQMNNEQGTLNSSTTRPGWQVISGAPPAFPLARHTPMFARVPTHVIGRVVERRQHPRAALRLPLRLTHVNRQEEPCATTLVTRNISSSGVLFLVPRYLAPGTGIELEVGLVERPVGRGGVRMTTLAHVVRADESSEPGWYNVAATFDDFDFRRDEIVPRSPNIFAS